MCKCLVKYQLSNKSEHIIKLRWAGSNIFACIFAVVARVLVPTVVIGRNRVSSRF